MTTYIPGLIIGLMMAGFWSGLIHWFCHKTASAYAHAVRTGAHIDTRTLWQACHRAHTGDPLRVAWPRHLGMTLSGLFIAAAITSYVSMEPMPDDSSTRVLQVLIFTTAATLISLGALIDTHTGYLPDAVTLPLLWLGLISSGSGLCTTLLPTLDNAFWGVILGYGLPWSITTCFYWLKGHHGLGGGDLKFIAALGAWLGWQALPYVLLLACLITLTHVVWRHKRLALKESMPFGPALAVSGLAVFILETANITLWNSGMPVW